MAHHGTDSTFLRRLYVGIPETGGTGEYPRGKLTDEDEGQIKIAVAADPKTQTVLMDFGKPTAWIGFTAEEAVELAEILALKAWESRGIR
jgi:hypothetical protein